MKGLLVISTFLALLTIGKCEKLFTRPATKAERAKNFIPGEPTCQELLEMWRLSKRQSRTAEVTNEFPTYRDPFARNVWEPLPRLRSVLQKAPPRPWSPPVYGRVVRYRPRTPPRPSAFDELFQLYHKDFQDDDDDSGWGGDDDDDYQAAALTSDRRSNKVDYETPYNSFDRIKQMILAERAKDRNYKKVKPGEGTQPAKNAQEQNKEGVNDQNNHYNGYPAEGEGKGDKLPVVKGGFELAPPSGSEGFRKPIRQSSAYAWMDPSFREGYW